MGIIAIRKKDEMGIRFRKSINLGKGFRINMSKSGPGFSWGGKGFRVTKKANGGFRTTAYIPGTGLSYQKDFSNPLGSGKKSSKKVSKNIEEDTREARDFGLDFKNLESTGLKDVIDEAGVKYPLRKIGLAVFVLGIILTFVQPTLIVIAIIGALMYFYKKESPVEIEYDFEGDASEEYELTNKLLAGILESDRVWLVTGLEADLDRNVITERHELKVKEGLSQGISTNVKTYSLIAGDLTLSFLPDALLINKNGVNKAVDYKDLDVDLRSENFLEEEKIADATFIEETYLHTNKDGGPDKRYKDNPVLNLVEYGILEMKNKDMNLVIVFSDTVIDGK